MFKKKKEVMVFCVMRLLHVNYHMRSSCERGHSPSLDNAVCQAFKTNKKMVKTAVFGKTTLPILEVRYQNLGGRCCPILQGRTVGHEWKNFMNIGKEEDWKCRPECTSTLLWYTGIYIHKLTLWHSPEGRIVHCNCRENHRGWSGKAFIRILISVLVRNWPSVNCEINITVIFTFVQCVLILWKFYLFINWRTSAGGREIWTNNKSK